MAAYSTYSPVNRYHGRETSDDSGNPELHNDQKRNMVVALLPWLRTVEMQLGGDGRPTASSYMLLVNLIEISMSHSDRLNNEIMALWQALATGPHAGNVKLILDFVIDMCLVRRSVKLVETTRQIIVFLSATQAGQKVFDSLLLPLGPAIMSGSTSGFSKTPDVEGLGFSYVANLDELISNADLGQGDSIHVSTFYLSSASLTLTSLGTCT